MLLVISRFTESNIMKLRWGIKIILPVWALATPLSASEQWETSVTGAYSVASPALPAADNYSRSGAEYLFADFGGRLARKIGPGYLAFNSALYSSFRLQNELAADYYAVPSFISNRSAEIGSPVTYSGGTYRLALGWAAAQLRYRFYFYDNILFAEAGTGPAYGFGALETVLKGNSASGEQREIRYHQYAEWGLINSASLGVGFPPGNGVKLEFALEIAWLLAKIRHADIARTDSMALSQTFFRPTVAITFAF